MKVNSALAWVLERLERPRAVSFIVAFKMWTYRMHQSIRRRYRHKYGRAIERERALSTRSNKQLNSQASADWEWRDMACLPRIFIYLEHFTTMYAIFVLWRNLMPSQLEMLISWLQLPLEPHCYSLGHLAAQKSIDFHIETLFMAYLLIWRSLMYLRKRRHVFSLYIFLTISARDLTRFCSLIEQRAAHSKGLAAAGPLSLELLSPTGQLFTTSLPKKLDARLGCSRKSLLLTPSPTLTQSTATSSRVSAIERLFRSALCYRVYLESPNDLGETVVYRLKPNRTVAAQRELRQHLAKVVLAISVFFLLVAFTLTTIIIVQITGLQHYQSVYPNCSPPLGEPGGDSITNANTTSYTWHALISMLYDIGHNAIIWMETGISVLISWTSTYFINYDTQLYWRELNQKLERLHKRAINLRHSRLDVETTEEEFDEDGAEFDEEDEEEDEDELQVETFSASSALIRPPPHIYQQQFLPPPLTATSSMANYRCCTSLMITANRTSHQADYNSQLLACGHERKRDVQQEELDNQIQELLVEFYSLFGHIREVDSIVSDIITVSIYVWVSLFAVLGHLAIFLLASGPDGYLAIALIVGLEAFTYFVYTVGCFSVLVLRNNCFRSYKTVCSLMAYNSSNHKEGLAQLLDYFAGTHCFAYTIFSQYPFTKTTYLSIIGWSFSFFFIVEGVRKR